MQLARAVPSKWLHGGGSAASQRTMYHLTEGGIAMRRNLAVLVVALSSAVLLFGTGHAQTLGPTTYVLQSDVVTADSGGIGDAQVLCNGSDFATGGGLATTASTGTPPTMAVSDSFPISDASGASTANNADPHGWRVMTFNPSPDPLDLQAFVVCLKSGLLSLVPGQ
ncbi:MAG: hypothetical protein DME09_00575 [Candidatus Rokuibacteriota bacterium]|nr:MAG: hypothetical protein DME09_00575 [Candidatus Rokubacteria bacterium]